MSRWKSPRNSRFLRTIAALALLLVLTIFQPIGASAQGAGRPVASSTAARRQAVTCDGVAGWMTPTVDRINQLLELVFNPPSGMPGSADAYGQMADRLALDQQNAAAPQAVAATNENVANAFVEFAATYHASDVLFSSLPGAVFNTASLEPLAVEIASALHGGSQFLFVAVRQISALGADCGVARAWTPLISTSGVQGLLALPHGANAADCTGVADWMKAARPVVEQFGAQWVQIQTMARVDTRWWGQNVYPWEELERVTLERALSLAIIPAPAGAADLNTRLVGFFATWFDFAVAGTMSTLLQLQNFVTLTENLIPQITGQYQDARAAWASLAGNCGIASLLPEPPVPPQ